MSAAWFLAWLGQIAPAWLFLVILFGVPIVIVSYSWWQRR